MRQPNGNVNQHVRVSNDATPTLASLGLTRDDSSRWQKLAAGAVSRPVTRATSDRFGFRVGSKIGDHVSDRRAPI